MKRQWALTTISIDDLNQPSFQVQIQPPTITYNKNTKSQQDLVVKTISPEVNPIKVLDLSKSTPILPINTSTNARVKLNIIFLLFFYVKHEIFNYYLW